MTRRKQVTNCSDKWEWKLGGNVNFSVAEVQKYINDQKLPQCGVVTKWSKYVPHKINIFYWRLRLNKLSTRINIDAKGLIHLRLCVVFTMLIWKIICTYLFHVSKGLMGFHGEMVWYLVFGVSRYWRCVAKDWLGEIF